MPLIDKPLKELQVYQGINERPEDFDAYWSRAIQEMEALGTGCELVPAAFQVPGVDCFDLYFTGVGGARIYARLVRPSHVKGKLPAVVQFHGYAGNRGSFAQLLRWAAAGFLAVAMDCRGQGGLSEDNGQVLGNTLHGHIIRGLDDPDPDKLYYRNVYLDTAQLARIVMAMPEVDATRVGACGGSQGGGLTLACAGLTPKLNRAASHMPFLSDYRRVWEMDLAKDAYVELQHHFRWFDPQHQREKEIFTKLGYIDVQFLAPRIQAELRMYTGLMDTICPPSTQFAAYNKVRSKKSMAIYPDFAHETYPDMDDNLMQFMLGM